MYKPILGELVIFTKQLKREKEDPEDINSYSRTWIETNPPPNQSRSGFVMGIRTVCDTTRVIDGEYGSDSHFKHFNYRKVAIVSYSLSRKPVLVPLDSIIPVQRKHEPT